jgi:hypothetical protein
MVMDNLLPVIGKTRKINVIGYASGVPAKIDTGADSSSIWASNISVDKNGMLHFTLFDKNSEFYTGDVISRKAFKVAQVRSSSGHTQIRYRAELSIRLGGKRVRVLFNLSDRSKNEYPILIGRRTITGKFLVDVKRGLKKNKFATKSRALTEELVRDPYAFFKKYHQKSDK